MRTCQIVRFKLLRLHALGHGHRMNQYCCHCGVELDGGILAQTLENTREKDETLVQAADDEVEADEAEDEYAGGTA